MIQTGVSPYLSHQEQMLTPHIRDCKTVLDFGCGDMKLDRVLIRNNPVLKVTGIDVVSFRIPKDTRLKFRTYTGRTLPFPDASFDMVYAYHVLHHTDNPSLSLRECIRVAKDRVVIIEPVLRHPWEKVGFAIMDWLTNIWKKEHVPIPYHIRTLAFWKREFRNSTLRSVTIQHAGVLPRFLPIGETLLFVLDKRV